MVLAIQDGQGRPTVHSFKHLSQTGFSGQGWNMKLRHQNLALPSQPQMLQPRGWGPQDLFHGEGDTLRAYCEPEALPGAYFHSQMLL